MKLIDDWKRSWRLWSVQLFAVIAVLPDIWQWWSTHDDDLDGGIHQNVYDDYLQKGKFIIWWYRTRWIWRNPAGGWSQEVFGVPGEQRPLTYLANVGDTDIKGKTAYYICTSPEGVWSFRGVWWPIKQVGLRFGLGWKLTRSDTPKMYVFSLSLRFNF